MPTAAVQVRPLRPADVPAATELLARSHADYPAFSAVWPDARVRARALRPFLRASVADAAALGASTVVAGDGRIHAVALWLAPGAFPWSRRRKLRAVPALLRTAATAPRAFPRFARIGASAERSHPGAPHWYLETLGVDPSVQRLGLGRRALAPGLERAAADGLPCYVETSQPAVQPFYRHLGFTVLADRLEHLPGGPPYLGMVRPPA